MVKQAEIIYLLNSGFVVKLDKKILVFDYYLDEKEDTKVALKSSEHAYFFSSHNHLDHFNAKIGSFSAQVDRYFLSFDIEGNPEAKRIPAEKSTYLNAYDTYQAEDIQVTTYSSTDAGISFLVELDGWRIFHAGDFNWWHWKGDTHENNQLAKNGFMKQMKKLDGLKADIAFFPVDSRLEEYWDIGAKEFCSRTQVNHLITMHNVRGEFWEPDRDFFAPHQTISVWNPMQAGESIKIIK